MRVRPLEGPDDARELTVAHARAWREAYGGVLPEAAIERVTSVDPSAERVDAQWERLSGYSAGRVHVAEDGTGTVRGYAVFRWGDDETKPSVPTDAAELKELYVDPDHWGRGFGTALLEAGLDRLPDDVDVVALEVLAGNEVGAGFYAARGFERAGDASVEIAGTTYPTEVWVRERASAGSRSSGRSG